jgi:hypothetical protein
MSIELKSRSYLSYSLPEFDVTEEISKNSEAG